MSNWNTTNINFGNIKVGTRLNINFQGTENLPKIKTIRPSCGCTSAQFDNDKKLLSVKYTAGDIPQHLLIEGIHEYKTSKRILVIYEDGTDETLSFNVRVTD